MPRLSYNTYRQQHDILKKLWHHDQRTYALLEPAGQHDLHLFYAPTKTLTEKELRHHRKHITSLMPMLPARAGKTFQELIRRIHGKQPPIPRPGLQVKAVVRPEVDIRRVVAVLSSFIDDDH